jgi:catechol 2,3-dioxygenase-like lactoylglutathione lyase family enzyme
LTGCCKGALPTFLPHRFFHPVHPVNPVYSFLTSLIWIPSFSLSEEGRFMKPLVTLITLGVDNLERSLRFYRDGMGLPTEGIVGEQYEHGAVVFIQLQAGLRLALWPRKSIAHDTGLTVDARSASEVTLGHNVRSKEEVDAIMAQARAAGAVIVKPAHDTFWGGYSGYFQDPDGHVWEVALNPQWVEAEHD